MIPITDDMFSKRVKNFLREEQIFSLEQLACYGLRPAARSPNVGRKSLLEMSLLLRNNGLKFVDEGLKPLSAVQLERDPDGYCGHWVDRKIPGPLVRMVKSLDDVVPLLSDINSSAAQLVQDAATQLVEMGEQLEKLKKENAILRSDNEQLWAALPTETRRRLRGK